MGNRKSFFIPISSLNLILFLLTFANLIADGAAGLARTLTRGLALAATAFRQRGLKIRFVDSLNMFHIISPFYQLGIKIPSPISLKITR